MTVGVLALQGDFEAHAVKLRELGKSVRYLKTARDLKGIEGIVLPGGESTAMLKLMDDELSTALCSAIRAGLPTLATCAGVILLAKNVSDPAQRSLGLIDVDVQRNAYGRQIDSCVEKLSWSSYAQEKFGKQGVIEGVFIRAPRISRVGKTANVLLSRGADAVLVKEGNICAATFHPELSAGRSAAYDFFL